MPRIRLEFVCVLCDRPKVVTAALAASLKKEEVVRFKTQCECGTPIDYRTTVQDLARSVYRPPLKRAELLR